jgi:hypothetical protein
VGQRLLYAITGHGFGHATRSLAIGREILKRFPGTRITYSTSVPREFLERSGAGLASDPPGDPRAAGREAASEDLRAIGYEPGTAEASCFEVDAVATRALYRPFAAELEGRLAAEVEHLRAGGYRGVISDISALPIAAAARAGIPSLAISNFTWDFILDPLLVGDPDLSGLPGVLAGQYRTAEVYLRLPFHPPGHPFRRAADLPLLGRRARLPREDSLRRLGLDPDTGRPLVLVSIGGLKVGRWPRIRLQDARGMDFIVVGDLPVEFDPRGALCLPDDLRHLLGFADLVAAADVVLAKPGYGTCSECAVNGTPMVGIERRGFAETPWLASGMGRYVPYRDLSLADFFAGRWEAPLAAVLGEGRSPPNEEDGAGEAARRIGEVFGLRLGA